MRPAARRAPVALRPDRPQVQHPNKNIRLTIGSFCISPFLNSSAHSAPNLNVYRRQPIAASAIGKPEFNLFVSQRRFADYIGAVEKPATAFVENDAPVPGPLVNPVGVGRVPDGTESGAVGFVGEAWPQQSAENRTMMARSLI